MAGKGGGGCHTGGIESHQQHTKTHVSNVHPKPKLNLNSYSPEHHSFSRFHPSSLLSLSLSLSLSLASASIRDVIGSSSECECECECEEQLYEWN